MRTSLRRSFIPATCLIAVASLTACGGGSDDTSDASGTTAATPTGTTAANIAPEDDALTGDLIGTGCDAYNKSNPTGGGSLEGMAQDPVTTAAGNNPVLKTLTAAVSGKLNPDVDLVDTLNSGQFTVFAPTDDAFAKVDAATLAKLKSDKALLTKVLTYHVVGGQIAPSKLAGDQATVEGQDVKVTGTGNEMKVNGATIVCGGVKTANATVYLIDQVLMPPAK